MESKSIASANFSLRKKFDGKDGYTFFFYRQLDFSSEPGVANEFWENEAESCLVVA